MIKLLKVLVVLGLSILAVVFISEILNAVSNFVFSVFIALLSSGLIVIAFIVIRLSKDGIVEKITSSKLSRFEAAMVVLLKSNTRLIDGYQVHWVENLQFCEYNKFKSLSLVCKVDDQLQELKSIPKSEDNLIVLGIIYFNPENNFINPRGINAFLPKQKNCNLFYTSTLKFKNRDPWDLSHFLSPKQFKDLDRAIQFIEEEATLANYWLKKTPTDRELIEDMIFSSYSKKLKEPFAGYEWRNSGLLAADNSFTLGKSIIIGMLYHQYRYAIIYRDKGELFMVIPKGKMEIAISEDDDDILNLIKGLNGETSAITFDKLSSAMEDIEKNICDDRVWFNVTSIDEMDR